MSRAVVKALIEWYYRRSPVVGMPEAFEKLRYPIGRFEPPFEIDQDQIEKWISDIETLPADLRRRVKELTDTQLDNALSSRGLDDSPGDSPFA